MLRACHAAMLQRTRLLGITGLAPFLLLTACAEPARDVTPWSRLLPSEARQSINAMMLDAQGEPAVTGTLLGGFDSTAEPPLAQSDGVFFTMLSDTGKDLWGGTRGGQRAQGSSIAVAPNGDVLLLGTFIGPFSPLEEAPTPDSDPTVKTFLARFDPRGKLLWSKQVGTGKAEEMAIGLSLTTNASGDAFVGGYSQGPLVFKDDIIVEGQEGFIASYNADGNRQWSQSFEGQVGQITAVVVDASGAVFAAGNDLGILDYAPSPPIATGPGAFITKLTPYGQPLFTTRLYSEMYQTPPSIHSIALSPSGEVVFCGVFAANLTLGAMSFQAQSGVDAFIAKISGATGQPAWLRQMQATFGRADVLAVAVGADESIYATGQYEGDELTFPGLTFGPTSGVSMFLAQLDADGQATDGRLFDHAGRLSTGRALAFDPAGALVLAGHFLGQIELDDQALRSAPDGSSFVSRLALPFASHRRE